MGFLCFKSITLLLGWSAKKGAAIPRGGSRSQEGWGWENDQSYHYTRNLYRQVQGGICSADFSGRHKDR